MNKIKDLVILILLFSSYVFAYDITIAPNNTVATRCGNLSVGTDPSVPIVYIIPCTVTSSVNTFGMNFNFIVSTKNEGNVDYNFTTDITDISNNSVKINGLISQIIEPVYNGTTDELLNVNLFAIYSGTLDDLPLGNYSLNVTVRNGTTGVSKTFEKVLKFDVVRNVLAIRNNTISINGDLILNHSNSSPFTINVTGSWAYGSDNSTVINYKWESKIGTTGRWIEIPEQASRNLMDFNISNICEDINIRRIATTNTISGISNEVLIKPITPQLTNNIISFNTDFGTGKQTIYTSSIPITNKTLNGSMPAGGVSVFCQGGNTDYLFTWETMMEGETVWKQYNNSNVQNLVITGLYTTNMKIRRKVQHIKNPSLFTYSNELDIVISLCNIRSYDKMGNVICGDQTYYNVNPIWGVQPMKLIGNCMDWQNISRHGYEWEMSTDNQNWTVVKPRAVIVTDGNFTTQVPPGTYCLQDSPPKCDCIQSRGYLDYMPSGLFLNSGQSVTKYYFRRVFYRFYRDCITNLCPLTWHDRNVSNIVTITLTSNKEIPEMKEVNNNYQATCDWSKQNFTFDIPRVNNNETYSWTLPSGWIAYSTSSGPYASNMVASSNSGAQAQANGGEACVTVTQPGNFVQKRCVTIKPSTPFNVALAQGYTGCDGEF